MWVVSILMYGCTAWTQNKMHGKKLDWNYTRMLHAALNKSWKPHQKQKQKRYGHLCLISKMVQVRRKIYPVHCWRSWVNLINDFLLWTSTHGCTSADRSARTYLHEICGETGCSFEDLSRAVVDRD